MGRSVDTAAYLVKRLGFRYAGLAGAASASILMVACSSTMPSEKLHQQVNIPVPASFDSLPASERLRSTNQGEVLRLTARELINVAFDNEPEIKSTYERFKSEEARYDFFYTSRDSLTPTLSTAHSFSESRDSIDASRNRNHGVELSLEKRFFDTSQINVGIGIRALQDDDVPGENAFIAADLRYPLWASREKLERASEDIFRQNELDDTQLDYIQRVRSRLEEVLRRFYMLIDRRTKVEIAERRLGDMQALLGMIDQIQGRDVTTDRARIEAEIAKVSADLADETGQYEVEIARVKAEAGLPFYIELDIVDEPFNPFAGESHEDLLSASLATDPELATLDNSRKNAEVQLDLAKRGRWDIAMTLSGRSNLEGSGGEEGRSDWSVAAGFEISAVDPRVTASLINQAQANIARFEQAIVARENAVYVDTLEPIIRIESLTNSRNQLIENLPLFQADYDIGLQDYLVGRLNIDDLLRRRSELFRSEENISRQASFIGTNVAELCAATGKFFEFINGHVNGGDDDGP